MIGFVVVREAFVLALNPHIETQSASYAGNWTLSLGEN